MQTLNYRRRAIKLIMLFYCHVKIYSHSFRLVTFSAAAAVPSLLHSQQFIMPSVRISKGVWGRRKSQRSVPRKWHKCRTELGLNRNRKIMASALCCSLSRGFQRRRRRLRHPLAFLCGMKFEWGSKRIKTWEGEGETCSTGYRALDALMRVARGNSCRQRISVIEYDKFCFSYFFSVFIFGKIAKFVCLRDYSLCVSHARERRCVRGTNRRRWMQKGLVGHTHVCHQKGCIKFPSKWLWKRHLAKGHTADDGRKCIQIWIYIALNIQIPSIL